MNGSMMQQPLLISSLLVHAERHHGEQEVVSRRVEGDLHRLTYRELAARSRRMANVLAARGIKFGDRVATLAWNGYRHMELYYAASGSGAVLHTLNPRLHPDQVVWIADHAEDQILFFDLTFLPLVEAVASRVKTIKAFVAMTDRAHMPAASGIAGLLCYEDLIEGASDEFVWPSFDENTASSLCYTSGTTGNPKGALYSHRSTVLHTYAAALPDSLNCSSRDTILPVVPMFHVNAWGLPYVACMVGAKLVFPGPFLDGKSLHDLFEGEGVTVSAGVPTVWQALLTHVESNDLSFSTMRHHRRLRLPAGDDARLPAALRRPGAARLGHDRDEPGRHRLHPQAQAPAARCRGAHGGAVEAGSRGLRRRHEDRWRRRPGAAARRQDLGRVAGAGPLDHRQVLQGRRRRPAGRRLVSDRRRQHHRCRRLHADHRPQQGRDQVRR
jgi:acyl-CoA synthetase (AMP-forming)/AMP-acid ligase II